MPDSALIPPAARDIADTLEMERARMGISMLKIYRAGGFSAVMGAVNGCLRSLRETVKGEGGSFGGWVA